MEKLKIIPSKSSSPSSGNSIENSNFVFPGSDQFENHSPPPSPPWTCAFPTGSVLDLLTYILSQNEQFFLEKIETTGQGSTGSSLAFRFLDNDLRPILSVIYLSGGKVLLVDGKEGVAVGGIKEEDLNFMSLDDEIRLFDASGRTLLLTGKEQGGGKDLRVSCGDFTLGLVDGFSSCKKSIISGKNSKQQPLFQIIPTSGEVAVEDVGYKIFEGKNVENEDQMGKIEIGSVRRKDGFLLLRLSPQLNVRTKAVILVTMVSIYTKYHTVIKSRSADAMTLEMDHQTTQIQKRRRRTTYLFSILLVLFFVTAVLIVVFASLHMI